jgi:hypothetical protein
VLPGVQQDFLVPRPEWPRHGGRLDELRAIAYYAENSHDLGGLRGEMDRLVSNVRSTVQVAVGASRHLLWYVGYQIGSQGPRD